MPLTTTAPGATPESRARKSLCGRELKSRGVEDGPNGRPRAAEFAGFQHGGSRWYALAKWRGLALGLGLPFKWGV